MKKIFTLLALFLVSAHVWSQSGSVSYNIFGDLEFTSKSCRYEAKMKKDIFDNLIFSDNNNNEITYEKKYLDVHYKKLSSSEERKTKLFYDLVRQYSGEKKYKLKFSIDILGKEIIEDNRGNSWKKEKDIFGNMRYEETVNNKSRVSERSINGGWVLKIGKEMATLERDIFSKWVYKDSFGNKLEFSEKTWKKLLHRYTDEEGVFAYLVGAFFEE